MPQANIIVDKLIELAFVDRANGFDNFEIIVCGRPFSKTQISVVEYSSDAEVIEQFELQTQVVTAQLV